MLRLDIVLFRDRFQGLVDGSTGPLGDGDQGGVSLGDNVVLGEKVEERLLGRNDVRMEEDLIDDGFDGRMVAELLEVVDREAGWLGVPPATTPTTKTSGPDETTGPNSLAHSDRLGLALFLDLLQFLPSPRDISLGDTRVVDQVQIDVIHPELLERFVDRLRGVLAVGAGPLGRNPQVFARETRLLDGLADLLLVGVGCGERGERGGLDWERRGARG